MSIQFFFAPRYFDVQIAASPDGVCRHFVYVNAQKKLLVFISASPIINPGDLETFLVNNVQSRSPLLYQLRSWRTRSKMLMDSYAPLQ